MNNIESGVNIFKALADQTRLKIVVSVFNEEKSVIFGKDEKGSTKKRDALFLAVFGKPYPGTTAPEGV